MEPFQKHMVGTSVQGRELVIWANFQWPANSCNRGTLILGGVHGNEPASFELVNRFLEEQNEALAQPVVIWPLVNPDGLELATRYNANGTDLNRNCELGWSPVGEEPPGSAPWSEPENRVLRDLVRNWQPRNIVTLHWALGELDADGLQSLNLLEAMWKALSPEERKPYRCIAQTDLNSQIGLPGSFGRWCGFSVEYSDGSRPAIVTLELPYDPQKVRPQVLPDDHLAQLQEYWRRDRVAYMDAVYPGVRKMLLAACRL